MSSPRGDVAMTLLTNRPHARLTVTREDLNRLYALGCLARGTPGGLDPAGAEPPRPRSVTADNLERPRCARGNTRIARVLALRQPVRVHGLSHRRLVHVQYRLDHLHRPRLNLAERPNQIIHLTHPRRTSERPPVRLPLEDQVLIEGRRREHDHERLRGWRSPSAPASRSSEARSRVADSTTVTFTPNRAVSWPTSTAMAPPPRITEVPGRVSSVTTSWFVQKGTLASHSISGIIGVAPVATTTPS